MRIPGDPDGGGSQGPSSWSCPLSILLHVSRHGSHLLFEATVLCSSEAFRDSHLARYDHNYVCLETSSVTLKLLNMVFRQPFFSYSPPTHLCVCTHTCTHGHAHARTHTRAHMDMHACTPIRARARTHTHTLFPYQDRTPSHPAACFFCFLTVSAFLFFTLALLVEVCFYLEAEISPAPPPPVPGRITLGPMLVVVHTRYCSGFE